MIPLGAPTTVRGCLALLCSMLLWKLKMWVRR